MHWSVLILKTDDVNLCHLFVMKFRHILILISSVLILSACEKKSPTDELKDSVNDALDRRPAEGVRDAIEDAGDAVKDAAKETGDAVKGAAKDVKKAVKDIVE